MYKSNYVAIAAAVRRVVDADPTPLRIAAIESVCNALAVEFAKDNPRFDRRRFLVACGVA